MDFRILLAFHLLAICFCKNKYTSPNYTPEPAVNLFRAKQLNLLFTKLQRSLSPEQVQQVIPRLNDFDKAYMNLKHERKIASDVVAVKRKELDQNLAKLLGELGAPELAMPLFGAEKKFNFKDEAATAAPIGQPTERLSDKKLAKLWQRAELAGFPQDQLQQLREEFEVQDKLVDGYHELAAQLAHTRENEIMTSDILNQTLDDKKKLKLMKEKLSALQAGYQKLLQRVQTQEKDAGLGQFKHARVAELWTLVQGAGLPEARLTVLSEELRRLDRKVEKLNFLKNELMDSEIQFGKMGKNSLQTSEHRHLVRKLDEAERKIAKLEQYIQSQIHSEL